MGITTAWGLGPACHPDTWRLQWGRSWQSWWRHRSCLGKTLALWCRKWPQTKSSCSLTKVWTRLWKVHQAEGKHLEALKDNISASKSKVALTVALGGSVEQDPPLKIRIFSDFCSSYITATTTFISTVGNCAFSATPFTTITPDNPNSVVSVMMKSHTWNSSVTAWGCKRCVCEALRYPSPCDELPQLKCDGRK